MGKKGYIALIKRKSNAIPSPILETISPDRVLGLPSISALSIARLLGVNMMTAHHWMNGKRVMPIPRREELSRILYMHAAQVSKELESFAQQTEDMKLKAKTSNARGHAGLKAIRERGIVGRLETGKDTMGELKL